MQKRITILAMGVLATALVACTPTGGTTEDTPNDNLSVPPVGTPVQEEAPTEAVATEVAPGGASTETPAAGNSELPAGVVPQEMFDAVLADALARSGGTQSSVAVQMAEQVEWSDGSLGCPAPDMMYTQAIVNGYQIILDIGGQTYDYRLGNGGLIILCENGLPVVAGT